MVLLLLLLLHHTKSVEMHPLCLQRRYFSCTFCKHEHEMKKTLGQVLQLYLTAGPPHSSRPWFCGSAQQQNLPGLLGPCQHCTRLPARTRCMCTEHRFASASRQLLRGQTQPGALTVLQTPLIPGCSRVAGCRLGLNTDARLCLSCTKLTNHVFVFFSETDTFPVCLENPFFFPLDFCKLNLKTVTIIQFFPSFLLFVLSSFCTQ